MTTVPLPPIPAKHYFLIGEVADLCNVKQHVLRYWEQEFPQLRPMKRRGNRRHYQHHEVLIARHIRALLYEQGFTISGARNRLQEILREQRQSARTRAVLPTKTNKSKGKAISTTLVSLDISDARSLALLRKELQEIHALMLPSKAIIG